MGAPMSIESKTLLKFLDDGEWHPLAEIHERLCAAVPPGKALRRYEQHEGKRVTKFGPRKGPELSDEQKIASGQRQIATDVIHSLAKRYVEVRTETGPDRDGHRFVRRRTEIVPIAGSLAHSIFQQQHAAIVDTADTADTDPVDATAEPAPNPAPDGVPAMAFFSAEDVRALIADEVTRALRTMLAAERHMLAGAVTAVFDDALDGFQRGMQRWLMDRLAELEHRYAPRERRPQSPPGKHSKLPRSLRR